MDKDLQEIASFLTERNGFTIIGHTIPDGDCIGSMLALYRVLACRNKRVNVYLPEGIPAIYQFLHQDHKLNYCSNKYEFYENFIFLDCADLHRAGEHIPTLISSDMTIVNIDHHIGNNMFGSYNLVNPQAAATGELLANLFAGEDFSLDAMSANALYVAMVMDTGNFQYANTTSDTLKTAAWLLQQGVDLNLIRINLFESKSLDELYILNMALNSLQISADHKIAWMQLGYDELAAKNLNYLHPEGIIDYARSVKGVEIAVLFREIEPDLIKIGFRSKNKVDVSALARHFNGGGHKQAAGAQQSGSLDMVARAVIEYVQGILA